MKDGNGNNIDVSQFTTRSPEELREQMAKLDRFDAPVVAFDGKAGEYVKGLKESKELNFDEILSKVDKIVKRPQRRLKKTMDYEAARVIFWRICKGRQASKNEEFEVDEHNKDVIPNLVKYFINDESGAYDLRKGILLTGDVGTGKTLLLANIATFLQMVQSEKAFKVGVCNDIVDQLMAQSYKSKSGINLKKYYSGHWCFDDLGDEPAKFQHYGNIIRPMDRILSERYKAFENGWCLTHGTTNLNAQELNEYYGKRVYDRIKKMFNVVLLGGESRRG